MKDERSERRDGKGTERSRQMNYKRSERGEEDKRHGKEGNSEKR